MQRDGNGGDVHRVDRRRQLLDDGGAGVRRRAYALGETLGEPAGEAVGEDCAEERDADRAADLPEQRQASLRKNGACTRETSAEITPLAEEQLSRPVSPHVLNFS